MSLKHWMLPQDHFKTHLFFSIFSFSAWILVRRVCQTFKALQRGHLTSVRGPISYRICFMACHVDNFSFPYSTNLNLAGYQDTILFLPLRSSLTAIASLGQGYHCTLIFQAAYCLKILLCPLVSFVCLVKKNQATFKQGRGG